MATTINATTTRPQAQQARLGIKEPKPKKFLHRIVINIPPTLLNREPTLMQSHIPLNQLGAGDSSPGRSFAFAGPSQCRHTTIQMQPFSAEAFSTDEEPESRDEDMGDDVEDGEEEEMEDWEREGSPPRSMEEMAEDIRSTPPHKRIEVLSPAALVEYRKTSPATCKSHIEQPTVLHPPTRLTRAQAITFKPAFPCYLCGNYGHVARDCLESIHRSNSFRKNTNYQATGH